MSSLLLLVREGTVGEGAGAGGGSGSGKMTLPVLLGIAIGGGVLLFICLAFLLIALASRRHRAVIRACSATPGVRLDLESDGRSIRTPSPRPRRLTKQNPEQVYTPMEEIQGKQYRSLSSLVLPWNGIFSVCGGSAKAGNGQQRGGHLRRNNSWIDEDAIHGPRVQNDGRRLSVRDSFILRTPTLPDMFGHENKDDFKFPDDHNNYSLQLPRPANLPAQRGGQPMQIPLRRTPSYELAEKLAAAARGGVPPGPQSFQPFQGQPGAQGPRLMPMQRLRHRTTESDLAEILRSTEQRLQSGTPSNSRPVTRQRATSASAGSSVRTQQVSPTRSNSPVKAHQPPARSQSPVKIQIPPHVAHALGTGARRQGSHTPSPSKRGVAAVHADTRPQHVRNASHCSVSSDADSLFGETTPEVEHMSPTGLSTPSRRSGNTTPTKPAGNGETEESPGSDVSSSLSTLYSINEPEDDSKTGGTGRPEGIVHSPKPKGLIIDTQMCDPFVTPAPDVPLRSPRRQTPIFSPLPPRLTPHGDNVVKRSVVHATSHPRSASNSPVRASFDAAKSSSAASQSQTQGPILVHQPDMGSSPDTVRPKSVMTMKPVFLVSSTTVVSMKASPGTSPEDNNQPAMPSNRLTFGHKGTVLPPPLESIPGRGSPVYGAAMGSPESVIRRGASPTARGGGSRPYTPTSPTRKDMPSPARSAGSPTPVRHKNRGANSPVRDHGLSRQPHVRNRSADRVLSISNRPSIVLKPANSPARSPQHRDFGAMGAAPMGLQSTVAQLRRMNSQMSTFSVGSSVSDPESPTLPNLRGGGFSPERSNSRSTTVVPKARPEANKPFDPMRSTVEEEEEDDESASLLLVRGPRPMAPTQKRAGKGGAREIGVAVGSPSRRKTAHVDGEDQQYMDKAAKRNSDYESATVLGMYIKAAQLLGSPDKPDTGTERHTPGMRT
ncbi:hypothetical protein LX32DRAFT_673103 [Colletotrichum zoysiae]|uniref:Uncharacterized protein n=1 Tax=Colletotrichum zoysiae TaxID=1216348 RepID=A0AAD9M1F3_9PEZI|nr:hypothetical protein LX32DRAFT_673103 [Colletotrichum zoysiae]